jgi:hypothetical protein
MSWQVRKPTPLFDAVELQRLSPHDSHRHAALRLHALSRTSPINAAFECRKWDGRLVYPKVVRPLHEVISAIELAELADARARGRGGRVVLGPKVTVTHRPDAARKRDRSTGKMKVMIVTGAPALALPVGCPCILCVDGDQLEAARVAIKGAVGDSAPARSPRYDDPDFLKLASRERMSRVQYAVLGMDKIGNEKLANMSNKTLRVELAQDGESVGHETLAKAKRYRRHHPL